MEHKVQETARNVDILPDLVHHTLLSDRKFSDYISIYDGNEANIYDGKTAKIQISEAEVLKGWQC